MDTRFNTIAGWVLAGGIAALALSIASSMYFKAERPEKMGYPIEGVEQGGDSGGAPALPIANRLAIADPAKGADVFKKCTACHTIAQGGANGIGPNLWGTLGEPIGQGKAGFAFSDALKGVGGNWDFDKMDHWLASPRQMAPGTKMTFAGLPDPQDRANVIAYINSQGSNLPLPKPEAAPAAAAGNSAGANVAAGAQPANLSNEAALSANAPSQDPNAKKK